MAEGFDTYRAFAPAGWEPPDRLELALGMAAYLRRPDQWCGVAEADDGSVLGHVAVSPAATHARPSDEPGLAHLQNLFVARAAWGTGVAAALHAAALQAAASRGFAAMRLFTPVEQARARRFYEREGWSPIGEPFVEAHLPFGLLEYRRALSAAAPSGSGSGASA